MELSAMSENNNYRRIATQMAERYGVDPEVYNRLIAKESGWDPKARGKAGELGLSQIMLETGAKPGLGVTPIQDRADPVENLRFGAEYLGALIEEFGGDYTKALQAYNGGLGNVQKGTVSDAARSYASSLLGGKEVKGSPMRPESRPSGLFRRRRTRLVRLRLRRHCVICLRRRVLRRLLLAVHLVVGMVRAVG
jgi:soluble lytic murein transglycosylase-like protein